MSDALSALAEFFFDVCGIFIPGFALLAALCWMGFMPLSGPPTDAYEAIVVVLASYLVGHVIFSFAQRSVAWWADRQGVVPKRTWLLASSPLGTEITSRLTKKWCGNPDCLSPDLIYEFCRNYIHIQDRERSSFLRKEQTYGELSRSMVIVSVLCIPFIWFSPKPIEAQLGGSLVLSASTVLFFSALFEGSRGRCVFGLHQLFYSLRGRRE